MLTKGTRAEKYFVAGKWRWEMSKDNEWIKIEDDGETTCYQKHETNREHCRIEEHQITENAETIGIVRRISQQNELIISAQNATKEHDQVESVSQNEQEIA